MVKIRFVVTAALLIAIAACGAETSFLLEDPSSPSTSGPSSADALVEPGSPEETAPTSVVSSSTALDQQSDTSVVTPDQDRSATSTTLTIPKPGPSAGSLPEDIEQAVAAAAADLGDVLGVDQGGMLLVVAEYGSGPADNPCEPAFLDRRDEESPLVTLIEVVLRHEGIDYRYVDVGGALHSCQTATGR